jgi:hypothetical protein
MTDAKKCRGSIRNFISALWRCLRNGSVVHLVYADLGNSRDAAHPSDPKITSIHYQHFNAGDGKAEDTRNGGCHRRGGAPNL